MTMFGDDNAAEYPDEALIAAVRLIAPAAASGDRNLILDQAASGNRDVAEGQYYTVFQLGEVPATLSAGSAVVSLKAPPGLRLEVLDAAFGEHETLYGMGRRAPRSFTWTETGLGAVVVTALEAHDPTDPCGVSENPPVEVVQVSRVSV